MTRILITHIKFTTCNATAIGPDQFSFHILLQRRLVRMGVFREIEYVAEMSVTLI